MKCEKCGTELAVVAKFCGACGNSLTQVCPVCKQTNAIGQAFCVQCGSDIKSSIQGIPLDRALLWQDGFKKLGWYSFTIPTTRVRNIQGKWGTEQLEPVVLTLLKQNDGPLSTIDEKEPWVFISPVVPVHYHMEELKVCGKKWETWLHSFAVVIATRCRFLVARVETPVSSKRKTLCEAYQWYYRDLVKYNRSDKSFRLSFIKGRGYTCVANTKNYWRNELGELSDINAVTFERDAVQTIEFKVLTAGPRFLDVAFIVGGNTANRLIAASNINSRNEDSAEFLDVIEEFCREIVNCSASPPRAVPLT